MRIPGFPKNVRRESERSSARKITLDCYLLIDGAFLGDDREFSVGSLSTGIVCGVHGYLGLKSKGDGGKFFVKNVVYPNTPGPQKTPKAEADR